MNEMYTLTNESGDVLARGESMDEMVWLVRNQYGLFNRVAVFTVITSKGERVGLALHPAHLVWSI